MANAEYPGFETQLDTRPAYQADEDTRADFMVRVYQHVGLALAAWLGMEVLLFATGLADRLQNYFATSGRFTWLIFMMGLLWVGGSFAQKAAHDAGNTNKQYAGLFGMSAIYALLFAPFLSQFFSTNGGTETVVASGVVTAIGFAGLTLIGIVTKRDLSVLRPFLMWGGMIALGLIVVSVFFNGLNLGIWFSVLMVGLVGAGILWQTQTIMRQYPTWAYVSAAVGLFSSLMTLFWYILRIFGAARR